MVSSRCKLVVREALNKLGLRYDNVSLGMIELSNVITPEQKDTLNINLRKYGLEILCDSKSILIERIKNVITEMIHYTDELPNINYSDYISKKLKHDYTYLSNVFSEVKGVTIQQYIILHKIERVKELLIYDDLNLTGIALKLNYSSVSHLSNQFKKVTGLTPSYFKKIGEKKRVSLEDV